MKWKTPEIQGLYASIASMFAATKSCLSAQVTQLKIYCFSLTLHKQIDYKFELFYELDLLNRLLVIPDGGPVLPVIGQSSSEVVLESSEWRQGVERDVYNHRPYVREEQAYFEQGPVIVTLQYQSIILCGSPMLLV